MTKSVRIVVVDDSSVFRYLATEAIRSMHNAVVCGTASNGEQALKRIKETHPDMVTLDVEMPGMDGIQVLEIIRKKWPNIKVIMLTSQNRFTVSKTIKALSLSAFGYILKPENGEIEHFTHELQKYISVTDTEINDEPLHYFVDTENRSKVIRSAHYPSATKHPLIVAIGGSTGATDVLFKIIPMIVHPLPVPLIIVLHMPEGFTVSFANQLNMKSKVLVKEAKDSEKLHPGTVYIAPGGKQIKIIQSDIGIGVIRCTDDVSEYMNKPSVNYLFFSLAKQFPGRVLPVILTGIGADGTEGLRALKETGVHSIAQNKTTSTVFGMPGSAIHAGLVDEVVPLEKIIGAILNHL